MSDELTREEILAWLQEDRPERLRALWRRADAVRREHVGDDVHLRGLIEISNNCVRPCLYCGLRAANATLRRYRMTATEILDCARQAQEFGYGTVVLQSGEDYGIEALWMAEVIRRIKEKTSLAVTLSLGERPDEDLVLWREANADRYLLRFETSNRELYDHIHPSLPGRRSDRIAMLRRLKKLGYEIGSGVMIGIPGQGYEDLAKDIETFRELDLDMIGVGPYIAHPATPLCDESVMVEGGQVPNSEEMTYKVIALTRLACPDTNIPSTTALATLNRAQGRELGLVRGANIVMPNLTPPEYRVFYEIYPQKACIYETAADCDQCIKQRILSCGRKVGAGRGDSPNRRKSKAAGKRK